MVAMPSAIAERRTARPRAGRMHDSRPARPATGRPAAACCRRARRSCRLAIVLDHAVAQPDHPARGGGDLRVVGDHEDRDAAARSGSARGCRMPAPAPESRLPVGSSARMIAGRPTSARAMATRWHSPPDSSPGRCVGPVARPTSVERGCGGRRVAPCAGTARGTAARSPRSPARTGVGSRKNCWNTKPMPARPDPGQSPVGQPVDGLPGHPDAARGRAAPGCRRWPAASTCPSRTVRRSRRTRPSSTVSVTDLSAATGGDPGCFLDTPMSASMASAVTAPPPPWSRP